jgi:hypothetical protein
VSMVETIGVGCVSVIVERGLRRSRRHGGE